MGNINIGDKVLVTRILDGRGHNGQPRKETIVGVVVFENAYYRTIDFKKYKECFPKFGIDRARITKVGI